MCECLQLTISADLQPEVILQSDSQGQYNGANYYVFDFYGTPIYIWVDGTGVRWTASSLLGGGTTYTTATISPAVDCPIAILGLNSGDWIDGGGLNFLKVFTTALCPEKECGLEDRHKETFQAVKLPQPFVEDDRGEKKCCCKYLVLADDSGDSFKNDITSAWVKVSDPNDTFDFKLFKDGNVTNYTPNPQEFPNEDNAYYVTINWADVISSDGVGCYELKVAYSISGVVGDFIWGAYNLQPYTIQNALKTARLRAKFNAKQEVEGINFTGADVESTFRFHGFIGNRQPNTETDNIIYANREMKRVIRENLNTYQIITDPSDECIIRPLVELFLLSENELYISDYNAHNHSYRYQDLPVIVKSSPEIEYYDLSRKAKLTCEVEDKFKNKRTYY